MVSVLFNEPKLLKFGWVRTECVQSQRVSVLFNEPKLLKCSLCPAPQAGHYCFSALQRAEIAEIGRRCARHRTRLKVSVLFNEPKLLKLIHYAAKPIHYPGFSALQRAEIAEIDVPQRFATRGLGFSALQRAEIAEIEHHWTYQTPKTQVSVLFNEPKLLKSPDRNRAACAC